jgi:hypothetical protein
MKAMYSAIPVGRDDAFCSRSHTCMAEWSGLDVRLIKVAGLELGIAGLVLRLPVQSSTNVGTPASESRACRPV